MECDDNITLVVVDCTARAFASLFALRKSWRRFSRPCKLKMLTSYDEECFRLNLSPFPNVEFVKIDKITNIDQYSQFMFGELYKYIDTPYCITIQDHAEIVDGRLFDKKWYEYDYIGAPWPIVEGAYLTDEGERIRVGNGGFSWRSRKLMEAPSKLGLQLQERQGFYNEDGNLTIYHRKALLEYGIKYAPVEVASKFSFESPVEENNYGEIKTFGYHRNIPVSWIGVL